MTRPDGMAFALGFDADGNRASKTVTTGGPAPTVTTVRDVYQAGRVAYQTDGAGVTLATFSYDAQGVPASVQVGADLATAMRYYYVYNQHGDVVALTDASGNTVASYSYDVFGGVTASETLPGGWSNPYRYDGKDRVRFDAETGLYWMSVRAYDPTLGRFLSRDPLNRQPLVFTGQPYVYAGNNPLKNVDPSGQWFYAGEGDGGGGSGATSSSGSSSVQTTSGSNGGSSGGGRGTGGGGGGGGPLAVTAPPTPYACPNTCLAEQYAFGGGRLFTLIGLIGGIAALAAGALVEQFTAGFGLFVAGIITGAIGSIAFSAGIAGYDFSTFDKDLGQNPVYLKHYRETIHNGIGLTASIAFTLGTALQALTGKPISALMADGQSFIDSVAAAGTFAVKWTGVGIGIILGAIASLLILNPLADRYLDPVEQLEIGSMQDCGNNTSAIEDGILCPTVYY